MEKITKKIKVPVIKTIAFGKFIDDLNEWWPKEYTWSNDTLQEIRIDARENGLCTEIGPYEFRCDWGRVTKFYKDEQVELKWQIGSNREPIPNPEKASDIRIQFVSDNMSSTIIELEHYNFQNHGNGWQDYQKLMNGDMGWDYILKSYQKYCEK